MESKKEARNQFRKEWGSESYRVVSRIVRNQGNEAILRNEDITEESLAAYRANVTRDTYWPYAYGEDRDSYGGSIA